MEPHQIILFLAFFLQKIAPLISHKEICFIETHSTFYIAEPTLLEIQPHNPHPLYRFTKTSSPPRGLRCACPLRDPPNNETSLHLIPVLPSQYADNESCTIPMKATIAKLTSTSSEETQIVQKYHIGFKLRNPLVQQTEQYDSINQERYRLIQMIELVFDTSRKIPIYVSYRLLSSNVLPSELETTPSSVTYNENPDLYNDIDLNELYESQSDQNENTLVRQQLAPQDDFLLSTWKQVTYFDGNTVPIYQSLQPVWSQIEKFVRKVARMVSGELYIKTGTSQISLDDANKLDVLPVPDILWKIIKHVEWTKTKRNEIIKYIDWSSNNDIKGIMIIMHNTITNQVDQLCDDITENFGWDEIRQEYSERIVYCCKVTRENLHKLHLPLASTTDWEIHKTLNIKAIRLRHFKEPNVYKVKDYDRFKFEEKYLRSVNDLGAL